MFFGFYMDGTTMRFHNIIGNTQTRAARRQTAAINATALQRCILLHLVAFNACTYYF